MSDAKVNDQMELNLTRVRAQLMMAICDNSEVRIEPSEPDDGVGVAWVRVKDAVDIAAPVVLAALTESARMRLLYATREVAP